MGAGKGRARRAASVAVGSAPLTSLSSAPDEDEDYNPVVARSRCKVLSDAPVTFNSLPGFLPEDETLNDILREKCGNKYQERSFRLLEVPLELLSYWYTEHIDGISPREYLKPWAEGPDSPSTHVWKRGIESINHHMKLFSAGEEVTPIVISLFEREHPDIHDGWHRVAAAYESGQKTILAYELLPHFECELFPDDTVRVTSADGNKEWCSKDSFVNKELHRVDGPAVELSDGTRLWYQHGELHRVDGPAIELPEKGGGPYLHRIPQTSFRATNTLWIQEGELHRVGGPAYEDSDGLKKWYRKGKLHRTDGPAIEFVNGQKAWYLNGREVSEAKATRSSTSVS